MTDNTKVSDRIVAIHSTSYENFERIKPSWLHNKIISYADQYQRISISHLNEIFKAIQASQLFSNVEIFLNDPRHRSQPSPVESSQLDQIRYQIRVDEVPRNGLELRIHPFGINYTRPTPRGMFSFD